MEGQGEVRNRSGGEGRGSSKINVIDIGSASMS